MLINTTYVTPSIDAASDPCTAGTGGFIDKAKDVAPKVALGGLGVYAGYRVVKGVRDWWNEDSTKSTTTEKPADPQPAPAPQPTPAPAPQPEFVTKADLDRKIEEMTASVTEALKNAEKAATIRIDDSALEKIAEMVVAKQAGSADPQPTPAPEKASKKSAK